MMKIRPHLTTLALGLALAACSNDPGSGGPTGNQFGSAQFALTASSCPVTGAIQSMTLILQPGGNPNHRTAVVERSDIDTHCMNPTGTSLFDETLLPGNYEYAIFAHANPGGVQFDSSGNEINLPINDIEQASGSFSLAPDQSHAISASIVPLTGNVTGNGGIDVDNSSFDMAADFAASGCCCPSSCNGESRVGCGRAVRNGICTGWTDPCGC